MNDSNGRFRCIHCGDRFDLPAHEMKTYEEGFFMGDPDCCDDCLVIINLVDCDYFSDADIGL